MDVEQEYSDNYSHPRVRDIFNFHKINLIGRSPWSIDTTASTEPQIHIAYRRHQVFSLYDAEYKALGKLEGH